MSKRVVGRRVLMGLAVAAVLAAPLAASAHDHDGWGRRGDWDRGGWHHDHDDWHRGGGYWSGGRWIAGAVVAGAVAGLVENAVAPPPPPVYYAPAYYAPAPTVVYRQPTTVVYESAPVVTRTVVYSNGY